MYGGYERTDVLTCFWRDQKSISLNWLLHSRADVSFLPHFVIISLSSFN